MDPAPNLNILHYTSTALFRSPASHFTDKKNARLKGVSAQMIRGHNKSFCMRHNISSPFVWVKTNFATQQFLTWQDEQWQDEQWQ